MLADVFFVLYNWQKKKEKGILKMPSLSIKYSFPSNSPLNNKITQQRGN